MTPEMLVALAAPFPEEVLAYRPEVWCETCKPAKFRCPDHDIAYCVSCDQNVTVAHTDVAYIPHPHIRARLDSVDPGWEWVPYAHDPTGRPAFDGGVLWILLTLGGKAVVGIGDAPGEVAGTNRRQSATSAIRNAAESLGVGRYLRMQKPESPPIPVVQLRERPVEEPVDEAAAVAKLIDQIIAVGADNKRNIAMVESDFLAWSENEAKTPLESGTRAQLTDFLAHMRKLVKR